MRRLGLITASIEYVAFLSMVIFLLVMMPALSAAATPEPGPQQESAAAKSEEVPPLPCTGDFDWVQFRNGEWIKGEIKELLYDKFTFDSDELDTQDLDWDDIYMVCSPRWNTLVLNDRTSALGTFRIEGDAVIVATSAGERHYNRTDLQSIIPGGVKERDYWSGKWSVGLTGRSGNTDQRDSSAYLMLQRRVPGLRTQFESTSHYGSYEGIETINNQQAYLRHDIFFSDQIYAVVPIIQYYRDKFQNIAHRLTPGAGLGWQIFDHGDVEWNIAWGVGYQYTRFSRVESGEDSSEDGMVLLTGTNFTWDLTKKLDLRLTYLIGIGLSKSISNTHHALVMFSIDVWKDFDFDVSFTWDRVENPEPRADGSVPESDDFRMNVGIGWSF